LVAVAVIVVSHWSIEIRKHPFLLSLAMSFLLSVLLLRPWQGMTPAEWPFILLSLGLVALWAAGGTVVGMAIGMLLVKVASLVLGAFRRGK
jgi:hypothetical protein